MAFSYAGSMSTDLDRVRFYLGDTEQGSGPKPNGENFSNDEVVGLITHEGDWRLAVAAGYETLAAMWAKNTSFSVVNGSFTRSDAAQRFLDLAEDWRNKYGEADDAPKRPGSVAVAKVDYGIVVD